MNVLEKILEEVEEKAILVAISKEHYNQPQRGEFVEEVITIKNAEEIIRSHMDEADKKEFEFDFNRVESFDCQCGRRYVNTYNDGWIPVEERLPEEKINPITKDFYVYPVTFELDGVRDIRYYPFGMGHWWKATEIMDEYVKAWMPIPVSYKPKEKNNE